MRHAFRILFGLAALSAAVPAVAQSDRSPSTITLDVNVASFHTERWARDTLNQRNEGLGVTANLTPSWSVSTGFYKNSYHRISVYALSAWTPLHVPLGMWRLDAGGEAGLVSGYRRSEVGTRPLMAAALFRLVAPSHWSINLSFVPNAPGRRTGFVAAQFSLPI